MSSSSRFGVLLILIVVGLVARANADGESAELVQFETTEQSQRYKQLIAELRCLVCQNQNLADSNADLAKDLRKITYDKITAGDSNKEIVDFMVKRYGDFVLYRPPLNAATVALWAGPFFILIVATVMLLNFIRKRKKLATNSLLSSDGPERQRIRKLLNP